MAAAPRMLFIDMPFRDVNGPALAVSTLAAILRRDAIEVDVRYLNLEFARRIGVDFYRFLSSCGGGAFRGEVFFTPSYYGLRADEFARRTFPGYFNGCWSPGVVDGVASEAQFLDRCAAVSTEHVPRFL